MVEDNITQTCTCTCFCLDWEQLPSLPGQQQSLQQTEAEDEMEVLQQSFVVEASLCSSCKFQSFTGTPTSGPRETALDFKPQHMSYDTLKLVMA